MNIYAQKTKTMVWGDKMAIVLIRTLIVYFSLLLCMRLMGKRQLGEMELSEFVVAALIADLAAHPLQDMGIPIMNGLLPILVLFCCEVIISGATLKNIRLRALIYGKPSFLIVRGTIDQKEMRKNRFTCDELMQELRNQGCMDISKIEYAILETDGCLNVIPFAAERPVSAAQLGIKAKDDSYPVIVIDDGRILSENIGLLGEDLCWLQKQLKDRNISDHKRVFLMTAGKSGEIYVCQKE